MDDDQTKEAIGIGVGLGVVALGLVFLLRKCFGAKPLPELPEVTFPDGVTGYGSRWQPGQAIGLRALRAAQEPGGVYVAVLPQHVQSAPSFFDNPLPEAQTGVIFPIAQPSQAFTQMMGGVTDNVDVMSRLEGFILYTYNCLNYINATPAGALLCNALHLSQVQTWIYPSRLGCQAGADGGRCSVARWVIDDDMDLSPANRQQLIALLAQTSQLQGPQAYDWLATQINQMPLYSLYERQNNFPPAFLMNHNRLVTAQGLRQWFTTGPNCPFVTNRANVVIDGVDVMSFIKNAVITVLYQQSARNPAAGNRVSFDVRDWSRNTMHVPPTTNTMNDRPPAIGLAHELIHAYHNQRGSQPGNDFASPSTTLFELLCVGLGPFAQEPICENKIRAQWPPQGHFAADGLNLRQTPVRDIYDPPPNNDPVAARQQGNSI